MAGQSRVRAPRGESLDFVFRAMDFASNTTRFGLILSAVQFFSRSSTGATVSRQLVEKLSPVTLVNLSNQSDWLFSNANMPALVFFARHRPTRADTITTVQVPLVPQRGTEPNLRNSTQRHRRHAVGRVAAEIRISESVVFRVSPRLDAVGQTHVESCSA